MSSPSPASRGEERSGPVVSEATFNAMVEAALDGSIPGANEALVVAILRAALSVDRERDRLARRVEELEAGLREIARLLGRVGPDEVLDQDVPAEQGRRWILSHEKGLAVVAAYNRARALLKEGER